MLGRTEDNTDTRGRVNVEEDVKTHRQHVSMPRKERLEGGRF